jgi:hypothetical protein
MKSIFLIGLILMSIDSLAQSKEDTESWILDKLRMYVRTSYDKDPIVDGDRSKKEDYSFYFNDNYLVVTYTQSYTTKDLTRKIPSRRCTEMIPIYDIESITMSSSRSILYISTNKETILSKAEKPENNMVSSILSMGFSEDGETDLIARINKAFKHLKAFYKKPVVKETF